VRRWLSDPLLHFLTAGFAIFAASWIFNPQPGVTNDPQRIELTEDDVRELARTWLAEGRPLPTDAQLRNLIDQKVAEEVLYREAVALGLDRDDQIIKRRLAQKMDFFAADIAMLDEPTEAALSGWFAANATRFARPPRASFRHLYFSVDKRGAEAETDAAAALEALSGLPGGAPEDKALADPFALRSYCGECTPEQIGEEFGAAFATVLFELKPGSWHGPIQSRHGWHLVWIDAMESGRTPAFEEVRTQVKVRWVDEKYMEVRKAALDGMLSRYEILVAPVDSLDLGDLGAKRPAAKISGSVSQ
jgi:hypothetical protein